VRSTEATDQSFDPLTNSRFLWQLVRHGAVYFLAYVAADIVILVFSLIVAFLGLGLGGAYKLWLVLDFLVWIGFTLMYWLQPVPALLAQHGRLLTNSAAGSTAVLDGVEEVLRRQETPHDSLRRRSLAPPGEGSRDYLEWHRGVFTGMVTSFPFGCDLYVGWSYWIQLTPLRLLLMFIGRRIQALTGRGNDMYQTLRYDSIRAGLAAINNSVVEITERMTGQPEPEAGHEQDGWDDGAQVPGFPGPAPAPSDRLRERAYPEGMRSPGAEA
jgi:hypothetical protein